jgi:hypothetical protein
MLTRRRLAATGVGLAVFAALTVTFNAAADEKVYCPPLGGPCTVIVDTPGHGGGPGGGGNNGGGGSGDPGYYDERLGWLNEQDLCYYKAAEPQPDKSDPAWEGHTDGVIYVRSCLKGNGRLGVPLWVPTFVWSATPPPGFGALPSPAQLAARAVNALNIKGPQIGSAPRVDGSGLVGLPVWLWTEVTPETWGPLTATAAVPGLSVTATATGTSIVWDMGDGHSVTCDGAGTPYDGRASGSPTCGYRYTTSSRSMPGGRYTVTGTTTWTIAWTGGGQSDTLTVTRASTTTIQIDELQVVTS